MFHPQTWSLSKSANKVSGECSARHAVRQLIIIIDVQGPANLLLSSLNSNILLRLRYKQTHQTEIPTQSPVRTPSIFSLTQNTVTSEMKTDHQHIHGNIIKQILRPVRLYCVAQQTVVVNNANADYKNISVWSHIIQCGHKMLRYHPGQVACTTWRVF